MDRFPRNTRHRQTIVPLALLLIVEGPVFGQGQALPNSQPSSPYNQVGQAGNQSNWRSSPPGSFLETTIRKAQEPKLERPVDPVTGQGLSDSASSLTPEAKQTFGSNNLLGSYRQEWSNGSTQPDQSLWQRSNSAFSQSDQTRGQQAIGAGNQLDQPTVQQQPLPTIDSSLLQQTDGTLSPTEGPPARPPLLGEVLKQEQGNIAADRASLDRSTSLNNAAAQALAIPFGNGSTSLFGMDENSGQLIPQQMQEMAPSLLNFLMNVMPTPGSTVYGTTPNYGNFPRFGPAPTFRRGSMYPTSSHLSRTINRAIRRHALPGVNKFHF